MRLSYISSKAPSSLPGYDVLNFHYLVSYYSLHPPPSAHILQLSHFSALHFQFSESSTCILLKFKIIEISWRHRQGKQEKEFTIVTRGHVLMGTCKDNTHFPSKLGLYCIDMQMGSLLREMYIECELLECAYCRICIAMLPMILPYTVVCPGRKKGMKTESIHTGYGANACRGAQGRSWWLDA